MPARGLQCEAAFGSLARGYCESATHSAILLSYRILSFLGKQEMFEAATEYSVIGC